MEFCVVLLCFTFFGQELPTHYPGLLLLAQTRKGLYDRLKVQEHVAKESLM